MSRLVNLTPHPIVVYAPDADADTDEPLFRIPPTLPSARCTVDRVLIEDMSVRHENAPGYSGLFFVPVYRTRFGEVENLPPPDGYVYFVVSRIVYDAAKASGRGAHDLLIPDDTIRYGVADPLRGWVIGQIAGCRAFAQP